MKKVVYTFLFMISFLIFVFYNLNLLKVEEESFRETQKIVQPRALPELKEEEGAELIEEEVVDDMEVSGVTE